MDTDGNLYSDSRLEEFLGNVGSTSSRAIADASLQEIEDYAVGAEQADDITILAFQFKRSHQETTGHVLELTASADLGEITRINESIKSYCDEAGLPAEVSQKLGIIFDDSLNNTISYGFKDDAEHEIQIYIEYAEGQVAVKITDDGIPFNPFDQIGPDTTLSVEEREIGGLGILLVKEMTDKQAYQRDTALIGNSFAPDETAAEYITLFNSLKQGGRDPSATEPAAYDRLRAMRDSHTATERTLP